jgi:hypothetical protein
MNFISLFLILIIAILADIVVIKVWRQYNTIKQTWQEENKSINKIAIIKSAISVTFKNQFTEKIKKISIPAHIRHKTRLAIELVILAIWTIIITTPYINFDENVIPAGNEFSSAIQTHHIWSRFQECGWCAIWNGSVRGGYPALADIHGSALHPIVIVPTLLWGVVNGAKISLTISFWFAGLAQWWLAKQLKVSALARLWTACMAIAGGQLTSRMELGAFGVVLSTAMCSLVLAALVALAQNQNGRTMVLLAIASASALLAGQGYMQAGLLLMSPSILFLVWNEKLNTRALKYIMLAGGLALLLAAIFLIPFLHFSPQIVKEVDPSFRAAQPIQYLPLNLVISDWEYYKTSILQKYPYAHLYGHYIGWIPVLLSIVGIIQFKRENRPLILFMAAGIILLFLAASAISLKWIANIYPPIAGIRHPPQISGLVIPLLLGLSAYGLDSLKNIKWPEIRLFGNSRVPTHQNTVFFTANIRETKKIPARYLQVFFQLLLLIPLFWALKSAYHFSTYWIYTNEKKTDVYEMANALKTPSLAWVNPPFGEHVYVEPAIKSGLKLSPGIMAWQWKNRPFPTAYLEADRIGPPPGDPYIVNQVLDVPIYQRDNEIYAAIRVGEEIYPCFATGAGGQIFVECNAPKDGTLIVQENMWTGWTAWLDEKRINLDKSQYLQLTAPAGRHAFKFQYLPWDVPSGIFVSLTGIILCAWIWRQPESDKKAETK